MPKIIHIFLIKKINDFRFRRMSMWVEAVNKHVQSGDFDRKVIMEPSEMNYKDDIPRPLSAEDHRPGNYHTVTIVQYDENNK